MTVPAAMDAPLDQSLLSNYLIVKEVLRNFGWRDLKNVEGVCRLWSVIAKRLQSDVFGPQTFSIEAIAKERPFQLNSSPESPAAPSYAMCFHLSKVKNIPFTCDNLPSRLCDEECEIPHKILQYVEKVICDPSCKMLNICSDEVYHISPFIKKHTKSKFSLTGFSIPKIEGVDVHTTFVPSKTCRIYMSSSNPVIRKVSNLIEDNIIKCLLVFPTSKHFQPQSIFIKLLLSAIYASQSDDHPFAVGGCVVNGTSSDLDPKQNSDNQLCIVMFTVKKETIKPAEFDCLSIVLNDPWPVTSQKLDKLVDHFPKWKHSLILKFTCFKRNNVHNHEENKLAEIFPNTPMVGCNGMGEIGINMFPDEDETNEPSPKMIKRTKIGIFECIHSFSTILVLLSWEKSSTKPKD